LSTFSDIARFSSTIRLDGELRDGDNNFGSSGQVLSSDGTDTRWVNAAQLSAGAAAQIAINSDNSSNANRFITFVDSSSGNNNLKTASDLLWNPNTNVLTAPSFSGNLTGTIQTAAQTNITSLGTLSGLTVSGNITQSGTSNYIRINGGLQDKDGQDGNSGQVLSSTGTQVNWINVGDISAGSASQVAVSDESSDTNCFPLFVNAATGNQSPKSGSNLTFNSSTGQLNATKFVGDLTGDVTGDLTGNADTATTLANSRNFSISGEITANAQSFNGSGNVTLSATVNNNVIDEANLKISNSPTNGRFLQCNTGVSGGLTWAEVTVPAANTLSGTTLASGITASSITSLGTLTGLSVDGNVSVTGNTTQTGQTTITKGFTSDTDFHLYLRQTTNAEGATIKFVDDTNATQFGLFTYKHSDNASNSAGNSFHFDSSESSTAVIIDQTSGNSGYYVGTNEVFHEGNDGPSSGLNADKLDDQHGSYYRNASNLNDGTVSDARLSSSSLFVTGMIIMYQGSTAPPGWGLCDGQGGRPDLRDRFIIGSGNSYNLNATGGSSSILLGTANLPAHTHQLGGSVGNKNLGNHNHSFSGSANTNNQGSHSHTVTFAQDDDQDADVPFPSRATPFQTTNSSSHMSSNGGHTHSVSISGTTGNKNLGNHNHSLPSNTGNQGGTMGQSFNNLPPYYALAFIIKL